VIWRSDAARRALQALADAGCASCEAARDYFGQPCQALAEKALQARKTAAAARLKFDDAVDSEPAPRTDWLEAAAALAEIAEEAGKTAEEAEFFRARFGSIASRLATELAGAADSLRDALSALESAKAPRLLAAAKSKALHIEEIRRRAREAALEAPGLADELKARAVLDRFSHAAEAVHRACDVLAAKLAQRA
jgi:hypothetical protein